MTSGSGKDVAARVSHSLLPHVGDRREPETLSFHRLAVPGRRAAPAASERGLRLGADRCGSTVRKKGGDKHPVEGMRSSDQL